MKEDFIASTCYICYYILKFQNLISKFSHPIYVFRNNNYTVAKHNNRTTKSYMKSLSYMAK